MLGFRAYLIFKLPFARSIVKLGLQLDQDFLVKPFKQFYY